MNICNTRTGIRGLKECSRPARVIREVCTGDLSAVKSILMLNMTIMYFFTFFDGHLGAQEGIIRRQMLQLSISNTCCHSLHFGAPN